MNIEACLKTLIAHKMIRNADSRIGAITDIRERKPNVKEVANALQAAMGDNYMSVVSYAPIRDENAAKEREVFALYMLNFIVDLGIRSADKLSDIEFVYMVEKAAAKAKHYTNERLYGSLTWIDASARAEEAIALAKQAQKKPVVAIPTIPAVVDVQVEAVVVDVSPKKRRGKKGSGRVDAILKRAVELYTKEGKNKAESIQALTDEFDIKTFTSARTYFYIGVKKAGIQLKKD